MRHNLLKLLLSFALILQGVVAVGGVPVPQGAEQHCAGHAMASADCACCPDGAAHGMSCTAQCSVAHAPLVMLSIVRIPSHGLRSAFVQPILSGPSYAPLTPPPIV